MSGMLAVRDLYVKYGRFDAVQGVSVDVREGQIVALMGANGAGKSTLLKTITGLLRPARGEIEFLGSDLTRRAPYEIAGLGVAFVPQDGRVFPSLTVRENLLMGSYSPRCRRGSARSLETVREIFPVLQVRDNRRASALSGGERQMLVIARALMSAPKLLLCDEVSVGLAPQAAERVYETLAALTRSGTSVLLAEQDVRRGLEVAQHAYVLLEGKVALASATSELTERIVRAAYFGLAGSKVS